MNRKKLLDTIRIAAVVLVLVLVASSAFAEVPSITVAVDGLSCPFCTFGLEKKLKKVDGVEKVETNLAAGSVTLFPSDGSAPSLEAIRAAVRKAGFTPGDIRMLVIGTLSREGTKVRLRERGSGREYRIVETGANAATALASTGALVAVSGAVTGGDADGLTLRAEQVEPVHSVILEVTGLHGEKSAERLAKALREVEGAYRASVSSAEKRATVESIGRELTESALIAAVEGAGLQASILKVIRG